MTYWQYLMKVGRKKKEEDRKVLLKLLLTRAKNIKKRTISNLEIWVRNNYQIY